MNKDNPQKPTIRRFFDAFSNNLANQGSKNLKSVNPKPCNESFHTNPAIKGSKDLKTSENKQK